MIKRDSAGRPRENAIEIMVIDDEPFVRSIVARSLISKRYPVSLADGANAVESRNGRQYDVITTHLRMSDMDGLQVKEKSPNAGLIAITGYPSAESLQLCSEFGVAIPGEALKNR